MSALEESKGLLLDFDKVAKVAAACNGIIPVAVQDADTNEVVLLAYTNREAFEKSIETRRALFWSTTRNVLWEKGATSGNAFELLEIRVNCEQNSLLYRVRPIKDKICHTKNAAGRHRDCFYRRLRMDTLELENLDP